MNCWTNSMPYGNGGLSADVIVLPVRIIMSPTCSSRPLAGRNTRSAAALTNSLDPPSGGHRPPAKRFAREAYGMDCAGSRGNRTAPRSGRHVVSCARFGGEESGCRMRARGARPGRLLEHEGAERERARRQLPGADRVGELPRPPEARQELPP